MKLENMKKGETTEQITLFNWASNNEHVLPCLALMYHIPNEGRRTNGSVLKAAGLKSGVPDVCLPVPNREYHGLYIEMKYGNNKSTKEQKEYMELLRKQDYKTAVCHGFKEAKTEILSYLQEPGGMPLEMCLAAAWFGEKCEGILIPGKMFSESRCRRCKRHNPTNAEAAIIGGKDNGWLNTCFLERITNRISDLSEGFEYNKDCTLETILESINKQLSSLVKINHITIEHSAKILSVAIDAYNQGKERSMEHEEKNGCRV